ncbi:MAG TPA: DUF4113 domain-containing protein [Synergistales bacterium]|nr:DUF4113 domain-containing protein [Synergistales bacterium]
MLLALCDCNNFFVSCERVRDPSLQGRPVIVLSHNDGCVVARSNEAKALGIGMAVPFFSVKGLCVNRKVAVLGGDHRYYREMSGRVMALLMTMVPEVEVSSIDEAYLLLSGPHEEKVSAFCGSVRDSVWKSLGIPLSVGVSGTKTLAKAASHFAKKIPELNGVCVLLPHTGEDMLSGMDARDVWGVGSRGAETLRRSGVKTALKLREFDEDRAERIFPLGIRRAIAELNGRTCYPFASEGARRKTVQVAPSFSGQCGSLEELQDAAASYAAEAAATMRSEGQVCRTVQVGLATDPFSRNQAYLEDTGEVSLEEPTDYTPDIVRAARKGVAGIFRPTTMYKRVSVILKDLERSDMMQMNLFRDEKCERNLRLMKALDGINSRLGSGTVKLGSQYTDPKERGITPAEKPGRKVLDPE